MKDIIVGGIHPSNISLRHSSRHVRCIHAAEELVRRSDMQCIVTGPVLRELCYTLFTDPRMLAAFATWGTRKETA